MRLMQHTSSLANLIKVENTMKTIILADIFGITPQLKLLASNLSPDYKLLSPYDDDSLCFEDEKVAYQYFSLNTDITKYSLKLSECLANQTESVNILGFSVGASALWLCADQQHPNVNKGIGFYSSQIRQYHALSPTFPIHLIFPDKEPHFDVDTVISKLTNKPFTKISKSSGLHGFMNYRSVNFNECLYHDYLTLLLAEI